MKKTISIAVNSIIAGLLFISGCSNFLSPNSGTTTTGTTGTSGTTGGAGTVEIVSPKTNGSIGYTGEYIDYKINGGSSVQHIELYVNGKIQSLIYPSAGELIPKVKFDVDKSLIGTRIEYYLFYFDNNGGSSYCETQKNILVTDVRIPPYPPYDIQLTPLTGGGAINIAWKDSSLYDVVFHILRSDALPFNVSYISPELSPQTFNFTDTNGILSGKAYYYKVVATKPGTNISTESDIVSTIGGTSSNMLLQPPSNLTVTKLSDTSAKLSWQNNSTQYTYIIVERRVNSGFVPDRIAYLAPYDTTFTDNTVSQWQSYSYRLKVFSQTDSAWTADVPLVK